MSCLTVRKPDYYLSTSHRYLPAKTSPRRCHPVSSGQQQQQQQHHHQLRTIITMSASESITEGSVTMTYASGEESKVFYNPVQVQNRDLSILMITLAGERQALRRALKIKEKELKKLRRDNPDQVFEKKVADEVEDFRKTLKTTKLVASLDAKVDGLCILDALAASGLRSLRYWNEIPNVKHITINDLDPAAVERAHENVRNNQLQEYLADTTSSTTTTTTTTSTDYSTRPHGIHIQTGDALLEMYASRQPPKPPASSTGYKALSGDAAASASSSSPFSRPQWDVIDLDPYGSAAPFLDAAVQGIASGGLLCVTCTDMAALGGSHPETCFGRYAAMPIQRAGYLQEAALRILLHSLATSAARYGRTIHPLLSVGMDFYVRVFVEVNDDKAGVSQLSLATGYVFQSTKYPSFHIVPSGQMGGSKNSVYQAGRTTNDMAGEDVSYKIGGPMWLGPLHDRQVVGEALNRLERTNSVPAMSLIATKERLRGLLETCQEELINAPLFYKLAELTKVLKLESLPMNTMKSALINAGYQVSGYHKEPLAIKTDAPNQVVFDILRAWAKTHPPKKPPVEGSAAAIILSSPSSIEVDFTMPKGGLGQSRSVARFPMNPMANWGPKRAATGNKRKADDMTAQDE